MAGGGAFWARQLDRSHKRAVITWWLVATVIAFVSLELVRMHLRDHLANQGFMPFGRAGFYAHAVAGRAVSIAGLPSQLAMAASAVLAGLTVFLLCAAVALLDTRAPFRFVRGALLLACLLAPFDWLALDDAFRPSAGLTLDLAEGLVTTSSGSVSVRVSDVVSFGSYDVQDGKYVRHGISMTTAGSRRITLLPVPSSRWYDAGVEAHRLAQALQDFLASGGRQLPAFGW